MARRPSELDPYRQLIVVDMSMTMTATQYCRPSILLKINGELVVWTGERLDFDALQRRMVNSAATVRRRLVVEAPASFVVFDVLAVDSVDIHMMRWSVRRQPLEALAEAWRAPAVAVAGDGR